MALSGSSLPVMQIVRIVGAVVSPLFGCVILRSHLVQPLPTLGEDDLPIEEFHPSRCQWKKALFPRDGPPYPIGSITALIPEAADAEATGIAVMDGTSGDTEFPHGHIKALATVGETDMCTGESFTGPPDGLGAYLFDDYTVRAVIQSESYGGLYGGDPLTYTWTANRIVNFTGSHVHHIDYDRSKLASFIENSDPASKIVKRFGNMIRRIYNLKGELVGKRNPNGDGREPTKRGAFYSNTDAEGRFALSTVPPEADWIMMSLCSAHLAPRHQWGVEIGMEDDIFFTSEEQTDLANPEGYVGLHAYALHLKTKTAYTIGAFGAGGFEKVVELNSMHPDYVIFALSGYNGPFQTYTKILEKRNTILGNRTDGKPWVIPENIVPARIYIGKKGLLENGKRASPYDFLARNGLRYGRVYGFAIDMSGSGPTGGLWRTKYHANATNGMKVNGKFLQTDWQWDGTVKDFAFDQSWEFQDSPKGYEGTSWKFWTGLGPDREAIKMEHNSPDPRPEYSAFVQTAGDGYYGHYYLTNIAELLNSLWWGNELPTEIDAEYFVYQGVRDVTAQIKLNGKGDYSSACAAPSALFNCDSACQRDNVPRPSLNDIDGFEIIHTKNNEIHAILQEDSSSKCGERVFLTGSLTHVGTEIDYFLVAISGGTFNSRNLVGIPEGTATDVFENHEFSGAFDASGLLAKKEYIGSSSYLARYNPFHGSKFILQASDAGYKKRELDAEIAVNDKFILMTIQAHNIRVGLIDELQLAEGGQLLAYKPQI